MADPRRPRDGFSGEDLELLDLLLEEEGIGATDLERIPRLEDRSAIPLSFAQQRLWFLQRLAPSSAAYNVVELLRIDGALDIGRLSHSLAEVIQRHEILRTTFAEVRGEARQIVGEAIAPALGAVDLRGSGESAEALAHSMVERWTGQPFDLARGPLLKTLLLRVAPERWWLAFSLHHIVSDGWSTAVLVRELLAFYGGAAKEALPALPIQYADYAAWQRTRLEGDRLTALVEYWRGELAGAETTLDLPFDRRRTTAPSERGGSVALRLPTAGERLDEAARRGGTTRFVYGVTALAALLIRYCGQEDLLLGTVVANRQRPELESLVGFFVDTLVLRPGLQATLPFEKALALCRARVEGAFEHQELPFERLVEELQPERDPSLTPFFQVVIVLQNAPQEVIEMPGLTLRSLPAETRSAKFDLVIELDEAPEGMVARAEYRSELFDSTTVSRLLRHFGNLIEKTVGDGSLPIAELDLLSAAERHQLIHEERAAESEGRADESLISLFQRRAEQSPDAVALEYRDRQVTYGALRRQAHRLAADLIAGGVLPGARVGLAVSPSPGLVVGILGILQAGAAYVSLDTTYPEERLRFIVGDSGLTVVVRDDGELGPWSAGLRIVGMDGGDGESGHLPRVLPRVPPRLPAYVIYTSGSTGVPKGVVIDHHQVVRLFDVSQRRFGFSARDVWMLFHSYAFDFSVWEIWGALLWGGRLVVAPRRIRRSPADVASLVRERRVTVLNQTPSAFGSLLRSGLAERPSALRCVVFGGEALEVGALASWWRGAQDAELINMYGITETTVHVTYRRLPGPEEDRRQRGSDIGRPLDDLEGFVVDPRGELMPLGGQGELWVGGAGLSAGYWGRPALTAERFVPHRFAGGAGERLYRTGDLVRRSSGGELQYLGRIDHQVQVRGFRIELGEVEAALAEHPQVADCAVAVIGESADQRRLVAFVVLAPGPEIEVDKLRGHLLNRLPAQMVPSRYLTLGELPLTPNGKVDRRALEPLADGMKGLQNRFVAPRDPAEQALAEVFSEVLGVARVGVHDNFFALGGDSIRSVRVVALAAERGLALSLAAIFESPTVAALAAGATDPGADRLEAAAPFAQLDASERAGLPEDVVDAFPLAKLQEGMLFQMRVQPDEAPYHNVSSWRLEGRIDPAVFDRAVQSVVAHHPMLRTSFDLESGPRPLQRVHEAARLPVRVFDLRRLDEGEIDGLLDAFVAGEKARPFELRRPPQLRFAIHLSSPSTYQFTLTENHAILDGWSLYSVLAEISSTYLALREGQAPPGRSESSLTYGDFVRLEERALHAEATQEFWTRSLEGFTPTEVPRLAEPRPGSRRTRFLPVEIPPALSQRLRALAEHHGVPVRSVLLAAHLAVLHLTTGRTDLSTGLTLHGRPEEDGGDQLIGLFLNVLPLRIQWPVTADPATLLALVVERERQLLRHRRFPLAELTRIYGSALFTTGFNFIQFHVAAGLLQSGEVEVLGTRSFEGTDLALQAHFSLHLTSGDVQLELEVDTHEVDARQIELLQERYRHVLEWMAEAVSEGKALAPPSAELEQARLAGGADIEEPKPFVPVEEAILDIARQAAERIAVCDGEQWWSYGALAAWSGAVAARLVARGIGRESRVAVCMRRSPALVAAVLGVLRAGAAFVPLDPDHPTERLDAILEDCGPAALLASARQADRFERGPTWTFDPATAIRDEISHPPLELEPDPEPDSLAYVIYTSGSTGRPKGVAVRRGALANYLGWALDAYCPGPEGLVPQHTSLAFDLSLTAFFLPLLRGGRALLVGEPAADSMVEVLSRRERFAFLKATPSHLEVYRHLGLEPTESTVEALVVGGEALSTAHLSSWTEAAPKTRLFNEYGPTEATVACCASEAALEELSSGSVPIGRPIAAARCFVMDRGQKPVAFGATGELWVGGPGVARGYPGRPVATAQAFVPDPFSQRPGERLYRTGDQVSFLADGRLIYRGRIDDQMKVRGTRVEPGEIETALEAYPGVNRAAVLLREPSGSLAAVLAGEPGGELADASLRAFLRKRLPDPWLPAEFHWVDELPLRPSGKIDRGELSRLVTRQAAPPGGEGAPRGPLEEALAGFFAEVLGSAQPVAAESDFFELGGHSLSAARVVARVRSVVGVEIALATLFEHPTVRGLAEAVERGLRHAQAKPAAPIESLPRGESFPLSFSQRRLWFLDRLDPDSAAYNVPTVLRLRGRLSSSALESALTLVVSRHEVLRTAFTLAGSEPVQTPRAATAIRIPILDLTGLAPGAIRAQELVERPLRRPFDLESARPFRVCLIRQGAEDHLLVLVMHHIVSDAWSARILVREVTEGYRAVLQGRTPDLPALPVQYADFAAWQLEWLDGEEYAAALAFWKDYLAEAEPDLDLPTDRPRPARLDDSGGLRATALSGDVAQRLGALARHAGATRFALLLASLQAFLYRLTGQGEMTLGVPVAGRPRLETEALIGFFVNTLVARSSLGRGHRFSELLTRTRRDTLRLIAHQSLPFERLVEELRPERSLSRTPLFQSAFVYAEREEEGDLDLPSLRVESVAAETGSAKFDLSWVVGEEEGGLSLGCEYRSALFDGTTIQRWLHQWRNLLGQLADSPACRLGDLQLLSPAERHAVALEWNDRRRVRSPKTVPAVIAERAASDPHRIALRFEAEAMTYGAMVLQADLWAQRLRRLGLRPGEVVAVRLPRSLDLPVALLAVWWAGGAYLPTELGLPLERQSFMARTAGCRLMLTRRDLGELPESVQGLWMDEPRDPEEGSEALGPRLPSSTSPAYVIYTSGSTGEPKGVLVPHRGLWNRLRWMQERFQLGAAERVGQKTPFGFDVSVWEFFWPLVEGATLVLARPDGHRDPSYLARWARRERLSVLHFVPSMLSAFAAEGGLVGADDLRLVVSSGEALAPALVEDFLAGSSAELANLYGPTEASIDVTDYRCRASEETIPIGRPIANTSVWLLDPEGELQPRGLVGEICLAGDGLATGYCARPALTAERFVPALHTQGEGDRIYRTGDLGRFRPDGQLEYLGRLDHQVKIRGLRVELDEISSALGRHPAVAEAAVVARPDASGAIHLVGYWVAGASPGPGVPELRRHLAAWLPEYMVPAAFVELASLPLSRNGKLDRKALPDPQGSREERGGRTYVAPARRLERELAAIWKAALGIDQVSVDDNFFDLGGHSLLLVGIQAEIRDRLAARLEIVDLFRYPTVRELARFLAHGRDPVAAEGGERQRAAGDSAIAVVGMAGRFPGAPTLGDFWSNLRRGVDSIRFFSAEELAQAGVSPQLSGRPEYVPARAWLEDADLFDAELFGFTPREAELTDPQHRLFLECAWEGLESAGIDPASAPGRVGVYGGASLGGYWLNALTSPQVRQGRVDGFQVTLGNDKDYLATRVAYKLGLKGPAVTVQTACSTSLAAVHMACKSLLSGDCDTALAGGVTVMVPQKAGYLYQEGGIASPDGRCRPFDAGAGGTVSGDGVGVVVLKRLSDALAEGAPIRGVIQGSAINNDGSAKVGYTAPSVDGQRAVLEAALAAADVEAGSVGLIEAHGTGTVMGDPVELTAIKEVYRREIGPAGTACVIGSLKSNVGHLDAAAGIGGLIKALLSLENRFKPPTAHFEKLNPRVDLAGTGLEVSAAGEDWSRGPEPRRAAVSSFGIGGTNVHLVLEEAPSLPQAQPERPRRLHLLPVSARTEASLQATCAALASACGELSGPDLARAAYTLQAGRSRLQQRAFVVAGDGADVRKGLAAAQAYGAGARSVDDRPVAFLFPGQGTLLHGVGQQLYDEEPEFREIFDRCAERLLPRLGGDLREVLWRGAPAAGHASGPRLGQTRWAQPALFSLEVSLAHLWISWGLRPVAMLGHSLGEYAAACLAGVLTLDEGLDLVAERGRLMQALPPGSMLSLAMTAEEARPWLGETLSIAAVNGERLTVVSGPEPAVADLEERLRRRGEPARRLPTSHAFHSSMMEPALPHFEEALQGVVLQAPSIPFVSSVTGDWITADEARDPRYWTRQIRQPVLFAAGLDRLCEIPDIVLLEVGPGGALSALARRASSRPESVAVVGSSPTSRDSEDEEHALLAAAGRLWSLGVDLDWVGLHRGAAPARMLLPTYAFDRSRYWLEAGEDPAAAVPEEGRRPLDQWFYAPTWSRRPLPPRPSVGQDPIPVQRWLIVALGGGELASCLAAALGGTDEVAQVDIGSPSEDGQTERYASAVRWLGEGAADRRRILFVGPPAEAAEAVALPLFGELISLVRAAGSLAGPRSLELTVLVDRAFQVTGAETLGEGQQAAAGLAPVVRLELPRMLCRALDCGAFPPQGAGRDRHLDRLKAELRADADPAAEARDRGPELVAYRSGHRWVRGFEAVSIPEAAALPARLRRGGTYLIVGGLGDVGLLTAEVLARCAAARLVLIGRTALPPRDEWSALLAEGAEPASSIRGRIRQILRLEEIGAEVLPLQADMTRATEVRAAATAAIERFGSLDGLILCAGPRAFDKDRNEFYPISEIRPADWQAQWAPRLAAAQALAAVADDLEPDFCLVLSSLAAVVGLVGSAAYPAAHRMLDAFAEAQDLRGPTPWIAVDLDNLERREEALLEGELEVSEEAEVMSRAEAGEVLRRILDQPGLSRVAVSTTALASRLFPRSHGVVGETEKGSGGEATSAPRPDLEVPFAAPESAVEMKLAEIWEELLGIRGIGVDDNFLALGGDSVVSIQMIARARQAGLGLTPRQVFEHQTIRELAVLEAEVTAPQASQRPVSGPVPLSPVQRWFFELELARPQHWNQSMLLSVSRGLSLRRLQEAVAALARHHDALRHRFRLGERGWEQTAEPADERTPFQALDLRRFSDDASEKLLESVLAGAQGSLGLERRPRWRVVFFDLGEAAGARLLLVAHHLLVDALSWRILAEDLAKAYAQLEAGEAVRLPPKTLSYQAWSGRLGELAQEPGIEEQVALWADSLHPSPPLPIEEGGGEDLAGTAGRVEERLAAGDTERLLAEIARHPDLRIDAVLLTALVEAFGAWTGSRRLGVVLEGHGREPLAQDFDLTRTVGWFTALFPLHLDLRGVARGSRAVDAIQARLSALPMRGMAWGLARYLGSQGLRDRLREAPWPDVAFLFLGQLGDGADESGEFQPAPEDPGPAQAEENRRPFGIEVQTGLFEGRLHWNIEFPGETLDEDTVRSLARGCLAELRALTAALAERQPARAEAKYGLDPASVAELCRRRGGGEIYPLTGLQQGFLFHALDQPDAGLYVQQLVADLRGTLDRPAMRRAWRQAAREISVMRASVAWKELDIPVQVVGVEADRIPWSEQDWTELAAEERREALRSFLRRDRARGLDLEVAPVQRLTLIRWGEDEYRLVWTYHHLFIDGWSVAIVLADVLRLYAAQVAAAPLSLDPREEFSTYVSWLHGQSFPDAEDFWRRRLQDVEPLRLGAPSGGPVSDSPDLRERLFEIAEPVGGDITDLLRQHRITLGTLAQAAWALVLHVLTRRRDLVFGTVVSGRSAPVAGIESMIGCFINTLPVRFEVDRDRRALDWLKAVQENGQEIQSYEPSRLVDIQRWSGLPADSPLFDSILVVENYPFDLARHEAAGLEVRDVENVIRESLPLIVELLPRRRPEGAAGSAVVPGYIQIRFDGKTFSETAIRWMARGFEGALLDLIQQPDRILGDHARGIEALEREAREEAQRARRATGPTRLKKTRRRAVKIPGGGGS